MSPEVGLTSANRSVFVTMLYAVQKCQYNYIDYVHSGEYRQVVVNLCLMHYGGKLDIINQVLVSSGAALRKRWHGLLFATIRGPDVMNS